MKVKPLGDKILVEILEAEQVTKGGIILPDSAKEEKAEGKVVAVGAGKKLDNGTVQPLEVKVGDLVLYGKYSGDEINIEDKKHKILKESEILAIVE